ncbi:HNH endonuclease [Rhizobium sp. YIM 134829]|uniref:HNH endonuclease n=1 Tax=Rhizobium sp. YIM 134829 TaxID=3390453 RepID=UPI00397E8302
MKLSQLRPQLGRLPPMLGPRPGDEQDRNRYRSQSEPWRRLYNTARWKRLRIATFTRDLFTCRLCSSVEGDTSKLVCDHVIPHKGDLELFWDETNLQTLCKTCHDREKQRQERALPGA